MDEKRNSDGNSDINIHVFPIDKLICFVRKYLKYEDEGLLKVYIMKHFEYGTIDYAIDSNGEIVALCRWNVSDDGKIGDILDFAVREDFRNTCVGKDFIKRALKRFNKMETLRFKRGLRGDERIRNVSIDKILKRNIF